VVEVLREPRFVGRVGELARLEAALRRADGGRSATVIVGGEAGIGKTRLVEVFLQRARGSGARSLVGACLEFGTAGLPYHPFVEALRSLVRSTEPGRLPALLGPGRSELARLLPELVTREREAAGPLEVDRTAQARLFELILGVLERLARDATVVLVVEDLHWADTSTRDLLRYLVRGLRAGRVLFVVTARSEELYGRHPVLPFLAELERDDRVERLELLPLDRDELAEQLELLTGHRPDPGALDRIHDRTDGNPFFVEQLVAATAEGEGEELPPTLRDVLMARIAALPDRAQEVLRAASAGGVRIDDRLLAAVLDLPDREIHRALREVVARRILVPLGGDEGGAEEGYAFRHTLLQEVVYAELFTGERLRLHAGFARALEARATTASPAPVAELAYHWDAARDDRRALVAHVDSAMAAERVYAHAEAHSHYERAIELWDRLPHSEAEALVPGDRVALIQRAAEAASLAGEHARAIELGRTAILAVDPATDPVRAGLLNERLRWFLWEAGDQRAAAEAVRAALVLIPADPPSEPRARALAHLGGVLLFAGSFAESKASCEEAIAMARPLGERPVEALALGILGWDEAVLGDVEGGIARFREALAIAEELGSFAGIALGYSNLAGLLDRIGRVEEALAAAREGFAIARRGGLERTYGGEMLGHAAKALLDLGRWDEADALTDEALERAPTGPTAIWLLVNRARLETRRGQFDDAAEHLATARAIDESLGGTERRPALLSALAELAAWQRRIDDVRATVIEGIARASEMGLPDPALAWLAAMVLRAEADAAERARARRDEVGLTRARAAGDEVMRQVERFGGDGLESAAALTGPRGVAVAALCRAELARLEGRPSPPSWAEAARAWDAIGRPFTTAYARFREAEALLAARGERADAARALSAAWATCVSLGAAPLRAEIELLARQARIELVASGASAAEAPGAALAEVGPGAEYGFTPREVEVLRLVAGGWSNQQIADALFISRKTASVHVSNILSKLGVDSRVEAAAIAHRLGLGADAPLPPDREA
jgi:DNA-binding CsgD family transcriptional regulator/tetratricopeptide (TPR) repeat protein